MSAPLHLKRAIERTLQHSHRTERPQPAAPTAPRPPIEDLICASPSGATSSQQHHALNRRFSVNVAKRTASRFVDAQLVAWAPHGAQWVSSTATAEQEADESMSPPESSQSSCPTQGPSGQTSVRLRSTGSSSNTGGSSGSRTSSANKSSPSSTNSYIPSSLPYGSGTMQTLKRNRWGKGLEADLRAVVIEAGLSPSCAAPLIAAARSGRIPQNPGILLAQLLKIQSTLEDRVGKRALASLLRASPGLVGHSCDTLTWHWEELAVTWGAQRATNMVMRAPLLLTTPPFMLWSHLDDLAQGLSMELEDAQELAAAQPRLLLAGMEQLAQRLRCLSQLLMLPPEQLRRMVRAQPSLLTYYPTTLESNLAAICSCLGVGRGRAVRLVTRAPALLMLAPATFSAKVEALAGMLGGERDLATCMVLRQPTVLSVSSELLSQKLECLAQILGVSLSEVHQVAGSNPAILTLSHTTLERKLASLRAAVTAAVTAAVRLASQQRARQKRLVAQRGQQAQLLPPPQQEQQLEQLTVAPAVVGQRRTRRRVQVVPQQQQPQAMPPQQQQQQEQEQQAVLPSGPGRVRTRRRPGKALTSQASDSHQQGDSPVEAVHPTQEAVQAVQQAVQEARAEVAHAGSTTLNTAPFGGTSQGSTPASSTSVGCAPLSKAELMAAAWSAQLSAASPTVRAALACFSELRHARLAMLLEAILSAESDALSCEDSDGLSTRQLPADVASVSLSALLRMSEARFRLLLASIKDP